MLPFLAKKMWVACKSSSHFASKNIRVVDYVYAGGFNESFINVGDNHGFGAKTKIFLECWKNNRSSKSLAGVFFILFLTI